MLVSLIVVFVRERAGADRRTRRMEVVKQRVQFAIEPRLHCFPAPDSLRDGTVRCRLSVPAW
jgi:hypothetical protein